MKIRYYHLRNKEREPRLTRCIIQTDDGRIAVGSALCSKSDFPNKKVGRKIAYQRALSALLKQKNILDIKRIDAHQVLLDVESDLLDYIHLPKFVRDYKGIYIDDLKYLNSFERNLIGVNNQSVC